MAHLLSHELHLAGVQAVIGIFAHAELPFDAHNILCTQLIETNAVILAHDLSMPFCHVTIDACIWHRRLDQGFKVEDGHACTVPEESLRSVKHTPGKR